MLVNATNLEYMCTGLNFGRGDLWYPPRLMQAGQTLRVETSSFYEMNKFIYFVTHESNQNRPRRS